MLIETDMNTVLETLQTITYNLLKYLNENNYPDRKYKDIELTRTQTLLAKFYALIKTLDLLHLFQNFYTIY